MDSLLLPSLKALPFDTEGEGYVVPAEPTPLETCPHCCGALVGFGRRPQDYADLPMHGKHVTIGVDRRRWRCKDCKKVSVDPIPAMDEKREATKRLVAYVQKKSLSHKFTDVAREVGIGEQTVRNIFDDYVAILDARDQFATPRVLGIDEVHLLGQARCILTNIEEATALDLLEKRTKDMVYRRLLALPDRETVEIVTMDMWQPYRDAALAALPKAVIVIDKWHVVKMANDAMDRVRKELRGSLTDKMRRTLMHDRFILRSRASELKESQRLKLDVWLNHFPTLADAYKLKEALFDLFNAEITSAEARERYMEWKSCITVELMPAFKDITTAFDNWADQIFAYFDHRVTNAVTEALNGLAKRANNDGRGYSFEVIRAKLIHCIAAQKRRPKEKANMVKEQAETTHIAVFAGAGMSIMKLHGPLPTGNLGVDLDKFVLNYDSFLADCFGLTDEELSTETADSDAPDESGQSTFNFG